MVISHWQCLEFVILSIQVLICHTFVTISQTYSVHVLQPINSFNTAIKIFAAVSEFNCIQTITNANGRRPGLCSVTAQPQLMYIVWQRDVVICD